MPGRALVRDASTCVVVSYPIICIWEGTIRSDNLGSHRASEEQKGHDCGENCHLMEQAGVGTRGITGHALHQKQVVII